jgi:transposase
MCTMTGGAFTAKRFSSTHCRNRRKTAVKLLAYDGQGFWLAQKRLSRGRFRWWPQSATAATKRLDAHELGVLLWGGDPDAAQGAPTWRRVNMGAGA